MRQTWLYHKGSDQQTYERFDTEQFGSEDTLRRFVYLLGADRVAPAAVPITAKGRARDLIVTPVRCLVNEVRETSSPPTLGSTSITAIMGLRQLRVLSPVSDDCQLYFDACD